MNDLFYSHNIELTRKRVKYLRIRICPPDGAIKVSAPRHASLAEIRAFLREKSDWIEAQQARVRALPKPKTLRFREGEMHQVFGKACALRIIETPRGRERVQLRHRILELYCKPGTTRDHRAALVEAWQRDQLKQMIPAIIARYKRRMGVEVREFRVRKMKSRWGSCNIRAKRVWLSLELASKPPECLEYVVVHEMAHLLEASHNRRFWRLVEAYMPGWREWRNLLNQGAR